MKNWLRLVRQVWRRDDGVAALEYALVAPVFFILLFVGIEVSFMLMGDASLDRAANQITRMGKIGLFEGDDCHARVMQELQKEVGFWASSKNVRADVKIYKPGQTPAFSDFDDPDYEPECNAGDRGDLVVFRLGYDKPGLTGVIQLLGINIFRFERVVVITNEP